MSQAVISQAAPVLHLAWHQGDPISRSFIVKDHPEYLGDYACQVRAARSPTSREFAALTIDTRLCDADGTPNVAGDHCRFDITASAGVSAGVPAGEWEYDIQEVGALTRFRGKVYVTGEVTV